MQGLRESYQRSTPGSLVDARPAFGLPPLRAGEGRRKVNGLYLASQGGGLVVVRLVVERDCFRTTRLFHLTSRGAWFSVVGWDHVSVDVEAIGAADLETIAVAAWTDNAPPELPTLVWFQAVAAPGAVPVPEGAFSVISSIADATAFQRSIGGTTYDVPTPLVPGIPSDIFGMSLHTVAAGARVLAWRIEGV